MLPALLASAAAAKGGGGGGGGGGMGLSQSSSAQSSAANSGNHMVIGQKPSPNYPMFDFGETTTSAASVLSSISPPLVIGFAVVAAAFVWGISRG